MTAIVLGNIFYLVEENLKKDGAEKCFPQNSQQTEKKHMQ